MTSLSRWARGDARGWLLSLPWPVLRRPEMRASSLHCLHVDVPRELIGCHDTDGNEAATVVVHLRDVTYTFTRFVAGAAE